MFSVSTLFKSLGFFTWFSIFSLLFFKLPGITPFWIISIAAFTRLSFTSKSLICLPCGVTTFTDRATWGCLTRGLVLLGNFHDLIQDLILFLSKLFCAILQSCRRCCNIGSVIFNLFNVIVKLFLFLLHPLLNLDKNGISAYA